MLVKAWLGFQSSGRSLPYAPPVARCPHKCSNLCASHTLPSSSVCPRQSHCCQLDTAILLRCPPLVLNLAIRHALRQCDLSQPTSLTCRPLWVRQPTLHLVPLQDKQAKGYIRGPASWHRPSNSQTFRDRHAPRYRTHQTATCLLPTFALGS